MKFDKSLIFFLLYWILYSGIIRIYLFNNAIFTIIPDAILIYLYIKALKYKKVTTLSKYINRLILVLCYIILITGSLSMILNGNFILPYIWNIRFYLRAIFTCFILWKFLNIEDCIKFKKIMYNAFLPNLGFGILQFLSGKRGDSIGGIFAGGNLEMLLYIMPILFISTADFYHKKLPKLKFYSILSASLFLSFIGEIKLLYIIIPLFWYIGYTLYNKIQLKQILIILFALFLFVPTMQYLLSFFYNKDYVDNIFSVENAQAYSNASFIVGQENGMNRNTSIKMTNELILKDPIHKLFGYGIGASSASFIIQSPIGQKYRDTFFFLFTPSYLLTEIGWIGFSCFIFIYILLLFTFLKYYKKYKDHELRYWSGLGISGVLITFILIWYNNTPILSYILFYYFFTFCLIAIRDRLKNLKNNDKTISYRSML